VVLQQRFARGQLDLVDLNPLRQLDKRLRERVDLAW